MEHSPLNEFWVKLIIHVIQLTRLDLRERGEREMVRGGRGGEGVGEGEGEGERERKRERERERERTRGRGEEREERVRGRGRGREIEREKESSIQSNSCDSQTLLHSTALIVLCRNSVTQKNSVRKRSSYGC